MEETTTPLLLRFDDYDLDEADARLTRNGEAVPLPPKAFGVLCTLARQPGQLVTKNALLDAVWGHRHISESVLKSTISELRSALADDAKKPRYIETASRRGYRFIGTQRAALSLPSPLPTREAGAVIGRTAALDRLRQGFARAARGQRRIFFVVGEAGIGKTTVVDAFVSGLQGVTVARGQCVEQFGSGEPYLPVLEALAALCRDTPARVATLRAIAPTWLVQLPWLTTEAEREAMRPLLVGASQERMLRELGELLDGWTRDEPIVLVTEDLHWSDHATVNLIDHVARRRQEARLLWLATFRLEQVISEDHPLKGLRHELRMHGLCEEMALEPFSETEVAQYVNDRFPGAMVPEAFVHRLHEHTDGLPLFITNVLGDVDLGVVASGADIELHVPENLAGVIEKQIARLTEETCALLEAASVCGVEFGTRILAEALERNADEVGECCDALARKGQWLRGMGVKRRNDGTLDAGFAFVHAVYRHVFYERIGEAKRARLHERIGLAMERQRSLGVATTSSELAMHFERAHDKLRALRHYADAAESALRQYAPAEAITLTGRALPLLEDGSEDDERLALELAIWTPRAVAGAQSLGLAARETAEAFERAHALRGRLPPKGALQPIAQSGLGWVYMLRGEYDRAMQLGLDMHARSEAMGDSMLRAASWNLIGSVELHRGELEQARRSFERGLAEIEKPDARDSGFPTVVDFDVAIHARLSQTLMHLGHEPQAQAAAEKALARAADLRHPYSRLIALFYAGILEVRRESLPRARAISEEMEDLVHAHGFVQGAGWWRWIRGWCIAHAGDPMAGHALIIEGYTYHVRQDMRSGASSVLGYAADAMILAHRWPQARKHVQDGFALAAQIGEKLFVPDLEATQARIPTEA